jgi:hypothetical protein
MASKRKGKASEHEFARDLPWAAVLQGGMLVARQWRRLSEKDRERIRELLEESGGRLSRLSRKERKELRKLAGKLDLLGVGRQLLPIARGIRGRGRGA